MAGSKATSTKGLKNWKIESIPKGPRAYVGPQVSEIACIDVVSKEKVK